MNKIKYYIETTKNMELGINGIPEKVLPNLLFPGPYDYKKYYDRKLLSEVFEVIDYIPNGKFYYPVLYFRVELNNVVGEFFNLPDNILNSIKIGQCKLLIESPKEGWTYSNTIDPFIDSIITKYNLKDENFVILTGNYLTHNRFKTVYFNTWEWNTLLQWNEQTPEFTTKIRPYKYMCLNRRPDIHRVAIATLLSRSPEPGILTLAESGGYGSNFLSNAEKDMFRIFPELKNDYYKNIKPNIPLTYNDGIDPEKTNPNSDNKVEKFYNSYLNIVTETSCNNSQLFLSEKVFKPIVHYQPFIVVGNPGSLALLKSLNYQTFSGYIDESYDNEKIIEDRLYKAYNSIEEFTKKPTKELTDLMVEMKPVFEHNLNNLKIRTQKTISSQTKKLLHNILYFNTLNTLLE